VHPCHRIRPLALGRADVRHVGLAGHPLLPGADAFAEQVMFRKWCFGASSRVAGAFALALLGAGWPGWRTWSPPREPAVWITTVDNKLATAPRLSSAAVICNKGVSYKIGLTQDAPPRVIVWTKCDE
jgi:hypothetical protein